MARIDAFCVGLDLPSEGFEYIPFNSGRSLLDADIILFDVTLDYSTDSRNPTYQGKPSLSEESSVQNRKSINHWRNELKQAFNAGKTIFLFLNEPIEVYAHTGTEKLSGTGRSQKVIKHVGPIDGYMSLPFEFNSLTAATGQKVRLTKEGKLLASYLKSLQDIFYYDVHYEHKGSKPLMVTKTGNRTVSSIIQGEKGNMLLMPPLDFDDEEFKDYSQSSYFPKWTKKAEKYGRALHACVVEIHKALRRGASRSPAPEWAMSDTYSLAGETQVLKRISEIEKAAQKLAEERRECENRLESESLPKCLLYETGKALEIALIDALRTFGFSADRYVDDESEFDVLFSSEEGRFLGEVEGKDNSAINIEKLQQLERNIQEDFSKEHVDAYAKGVLFGNPHRLTEPKKRDTLFTKKALSAAERSGFALVHIPDLFPIVQYLKEKKNKAFSKKVRECFAKVAGNIISFPAVPKS